MQGILHGGVTPPRVMQDVFVLHGALRLTTLPPMQEQDRNVSSCVRQIGRKIVPNLGRGAVVEFCRGACSYNTVQNLASVFAPPLPPTYNVESVASEEVRMVHVVGLYFLDINFVQGGKGESEAKYCTMW